MKKILTIVFVLFFLTESFSQLKKIESKALDVISTGPQLDYVLKHAILCSNSALNFHKKLFDYEPQEKIFVMFQDFGDFGNGGATSIPHNFTTACISPMNYSFESSTAGERVFSIMNHEMVHITALDNASSSDLFYQKLFAGKVLNTNDHPISMFYSYLTSPRYYSPRWLHEGIAVFLETWMDGGKGNALGNYDEMFFRTRVLENSRIYSAQGLESEGTSADFMAKANSYYYGTRFMSYLAYQYNPTDLIEWIKRKDGSKRGFANNFKHVFGIPISDAWDNWIDFEKDFQNKNIENLNLNPITKDEEINDKALGGVSFAYHNKERNTIYVAVSYPGKVPHLAEMDLNTGKIKRLKDIKGFALFDVASLAYDKKNDLLFYTTDNNSRRDLNQYDLKTGKSKLLQKDARVGDLAFNKVDESLWGIRHLNGKSTIVEIPKYNSENPDKNYFVWKQKYTLPFGSDIFDIDVSPDGKSLSAAVTDINGNQVLNIYKISTLDNFKKENIEVQEVFDFDVSSPQSFRYSEDGSYLLGSSYYSGVSNIYKVDSASLEIEIFSNAETGYFRPIPINDDKIFAFKYTSDGFKPVYIPNKPAESVSSIKFLGNETIKKHPMLADWQIYGPNAETFNADYDALDAKEGIYVPSKEVKLSYAYPIVVGYKDNFGIGYKFSFRDPLSSKTLDFSLSYTPNQWKNDLINTNSNIDKEEEFHASLNYSTTNIGGGLLAGKTNIYASYNKADFYDLFGPTQRSRKGLNLGTDFNKTIISDSPVHLDLNVGASAYYGLNQSPEFQQINFANKDFNTDVFYNFHTSLAYRNIKGSVGAVGAEKGIKSNLSLSTAMSSGNFFPKINGNLDFGVQLPIKHTSLWLRNAFGNSFSKKVNPFTRFGFASFGNNYIDNASSKMYRRSFAFAGLSYDSEKSIIAKNYYKATLELILPAIRYRKFGFFNLFATYTHPTIFAGSLFTKNYEEFEDKSKGAGKIGKEYSETFRNLGFQIDTKLVMFSHLSSTISFGWAKAFSEGKDHKEYDEWMVSLKF
jgi:hypothetical protein